VGLTLNPVRIAARRGPRGLAFPPIWENREDNRHACSGLRETGTVLPCPGCGVPIRLEDTTDSPVARGVRVVVAVLLGVPMMIGAIVLAVWGARSMRSMCAVVVEKEDET